MFNDLRRFWEQREVLQRMMDPTDDLRGHIDSLEDTYKDSLEDTYKRLGIGSAMMDFLRKEEERRKLPFVIADVGGLAKVSEDIERHRKLLEGPLEEARRLGLFDPQSDIRNLINATIEAQQAYEHLFRLPEVTELGRIAHEAMESASLARTVLVEDRLQAAMAAMHSPWLQIEDRLASAKAFSAIIAMGSGIDSLPAFDHDFAASLRFGLGDWRDLLTLTPEPLIDPVLRSDFYVDQGFDPELTNFTTSAFDESLRIAGLCEPEVNESVDDQEHHFARARAAFDQLQRFEDAIRRFIERVMHAAFGDDWMKRQLPANMLDAWIDKRDKAVKAGHPEQPLIDYADFTDYRAIIERKDNWNAVFKPVFGRAEDVRESFQRLFPVRIATMHSRLITRDDELLLLVETKRVLKVINVK
tara:strand:+ start:10270 stop:11514 length:1245 start_codon:yes stop_codon:yes gene_type:complete